MPADPNTTGTSEIIHATTVCAEGRGVLIFGPSGSGKSSLALRLMSLGAVLVSDDRTCIDRQGDTLVATAPRTIKGKIEARGVGILDAPVQDTTRVDLVVDLSLTTKDRLPEPRTHRLLGLDLPCLHNADHVHFPDAVLLYLRQSISQR